MKRRSFFKLLTTAAVAPAIITTPGVLMPVKTIITPVNHSLIDKIIAAKEILDKQNPAAKGLILSEWAYKELTSNDILLVNKQLAGKVITSENLEPGQEFVMNIVPRQEFPPMRNIGTKTLMAHEKAKLISQDYNFAAHYGVLS